MNLQGIPVGVEELDLAQSEFANATLDPNTVLTITQARLSGRIVDLPLR